MEPSLVYVQKLLWLNLQGPGYLLHGSLDYTASPLRPLVGVQADTGLRGDLLLRLQLALSEAPRRGGVTGKLKPPRTALRRPCSAIPF